MFHSIGGYITLEKKLLANNKQAVQEDLYNLLKTILLACAFLFSLLVGYFYFFNSKPNFLLIYLVGVLLSITFLVIILKVESYNAYLTTFYIFATYIFSVLTYIGAIVRPEGTATSIVVLLVLFPILISDKFLRVNGFLLFFYISYSVICFKVKPVEIATEDFINITSLTTIGFFIGNNYRKTKLKSFDIQRKTKENETIDFLTRLPNRRLMYLRIEESKKGNSSKPITGMMMIDIDHFKLYNDSKGHLKGDACLKKISDLFLKITSEKGIEIFRYGGEEFVALYCEDDEAKMDYLANYILDEVRALELEFKECDRKKVTVSLGYTFSSMEENCGSNYLIDIADKALYLAKNSGRNKAVKI